MEKISTILKSALLILFCSLFTQNSKGQTISYTLLVGDTAVLSVSGITGSFQWQQSTDSINWSDVPGANTNPIEIITTDSPTGEIFFRAQITSSDLCSSHTVTSNAIKYWIASNTTQIQVGNYFHGGIVFHNEDSGEGLIAPLHDIGKYPWGCYGYTTHASSETDGAANTLTILNTCSERPIAASVCDTAIINGYSDWYLPSKDQLTYLYQNRMYFGPFADDHGGYGGYWSSTEFDGDYACFYWFESGSLCCGCSSDVYNKTNDKSVRCIRTFNSEEKNGKLIFNPIAVTIPPVFGNEEICLVTIDTTVEKNKIIWEKPFNSGIINFKIYKETGLDEYSLIGIVPYNQPSYFIDTTSKPGSHGDKYKISVVDTCGYESSLSHFHKTINLTIAVNGTTMGLNWDDYIDESGAFVPSKFYIYRGPDAHSLVLYDSISASFHSYNDINVTNSFYYMIGVKKTNGCIIDRGSTNMAFSNKKSNFMAGINEISNHLQLNINPNPFDQYTTLSINETENKYYNIRIIDLTGKVVREYKNNVSGKFIIERENLQSGIYFIYLIGKEKNIIKKLIIL